MNKNKKGFSIIEVLFSIAIISLVMVMVIIFYGYMMNVSAKGVDITIASQVAESKLNEVASSDDSSELRQGLTSITAGNPSLITGRQRNGNTDYYWLVRISSLSGANYTKMNLLFVDVLVFWWAGDTVTTTTTNEAGEQVENISVDTSHNEQYMSQTIKNKFEESGDLYLSDNDIADSFGGMSKNSNKGYKFVRLSRIISKD